MSNELFRSLGIDLPQIIAQEIGPIVLAATLTRTATKPHPTRLNGSPIKSRTLNDCRGFIEQFSKRERENPKIQANDVKIILLGGTLPPGLVPEEGDEIFIEENNYKVQDLIDRDPAAATYTLQARL